MRSAFDHEAKAGVAEPLLTGLEQAVDAVVLFDSDHRVTHFNAAAERLWGYRRVEVIGRDIGLLVPEAKSARDDSCIVDVDRIVGHGREVKLEHKDGGEICGALSMSRVEVAGAQVYMCVVRDITEDVKCRLDNARLSLLVDSTQRPVFMAGDDARIVYVNPAFTRLFGYSIEDAIGRTPEELLIGARTDHAAIERLQRQVLTEGFAEDELLVYDSNGQEIWISAAVNAIFDDNGQLKHLVSLLTDITETKQLQSLQQHVLEAMADERTLGEVMYHLCRKVEQIAPDAVCSMSYIDPSGRVHLLGGPSIPDSHVELCTGIELGPEVGGFSGKVFNGESVIVADVSVASPWQPYFAVMIAAGMKACWISPIKAKDGRVIGAFTFHYKERRSPSRWHRSIVDACVHLGAVALEREEARKEISRLAYFDALTGLPNRVNMRQLMQRAINDCPAGQTIAFLFIDLDHFKDINDTHGHSTGDEVLIAFTQRLGDHVRSGDVLARQSGDEFVLMLPDCTAEHAARIAGNITAALSTPFQLSRSQVAVSISAGISLYPDHAHDPEALLKYADIAMYKAKQAGRSTCRFFSAEMDCIGEERLAFSSALRLALLHNRLRLHYQPQIRAGDGRLYGVEALARWHDPELGEVSPAKFIPLAEECGLIEQIGVWSLREACRQLAVWREAGLDVPCVSVNLSPINFQNAELPELVTGILADHGLSPDRLMLEITEGVVMNEHAVVIETMRRIRAAGVGLSMDDFGTGYSSLSQLAHLPVRELKIDRSFMRNIESEVCAFAIANAVVRVGQSLNMTVVAEGVETEGQLKILIELGCDVIQGFLYSPALAAADFEAWLGARHVEQWETLMSECRTASVQDNMAHDKLAHNKRASTAKISAVAGGFRLVSN